MVDLPGNLERSTLGDLLGALHRDRITGALCLREKNAGGGSTHVIHFSDGLICDVETGGSDSPGDAQARRARLEALFALSRAQISFRVMGAHSRRATRPLGPTEFLHGRRRFRDAGSPGTQPRAPARSAARTEALAILGLGDDATASAVNDAFRRMARRWHPDRYPQAGERTRAALSRHFARISLAYRELTSRAL